MDTHHIPHRCRRVAPERRTCRLAFAQLFFRGERKARDVRQRAKIAALYSGGMKFVAVKRRTLPQIVELLAKFALLKRAQTSRIDRLDFRVEILAWCHWKERVPAWLYRPAARRLQQTEAIIAPDRVSLVNPQQNTYFPRHSYGPFFIGSTLASWK